MPRPPLDALDDDVRALQQLARINSRLQSLERGQLGIQHNLQQLCMSLKSGNVLDAVLDAGDAEKVEDTVRVSATERVSAAPMHVPKTNKATEPESATRELPGASVQAKPNLETQRSKSVVVKQHLTTRALFHLSHIFEVAEDVEAEHEDTALAKRNYATYMANRVFTMSKQELETKIDMFIGVVIMLNAFFMGLAMDYKDEKPAWMVVDVIFSVIFISELLFKVWVHGFVEQFCGSSAIANSFDAFLILLDLVQLIIELVSPSVAKELESAPSASLFRVVRLLRLTRIVRAMKSDMFKSLAEMIHGIAAGMSTLVWSIVLSFLALYTISLVLREALGRSRHVLGESSSGKENIRLMFASVPRSLLTMYRCSFGDCSFPDGTPIFESVLPHYGPAWVLFCTMAMFVVTVVLFNVISAMFVERTMAAASTLRLGKGIEKLGDERFLFWKVTSFIKRIIEITPDLDFPDGKLSDCIDDIMQMYVPMNFLELALQDSEIIQILNELDINPLDHHRLSDIFDPDNNGTLEIADVAAGIRRMRGEPRRSDIVCIDLMVRSMQTSLAETFDMMTEIKNALNH